MSAGETANGNDAQDALSALNDLIDAWQLERLFIFTIARTTKTSELGRLVVEPFWTQAEQEFLERLDAITIDVDETAGEVLDKMLREARTFRQV